MVTPTPVKVTLEEYLALPETTLPHELVDGELRVTAAPSTWHQTVLNRIARALEDFVESRNLGLLFRAPVDVILDPVAGLVLQSDIIYIRQERAGIVRERIEGVPDLVVEILSPGTRDYDRIEKSARYAAAGVTEYWLADSENRTIVGAPSRPISNSSWKRQHLSRWPKPQQPPGRGTNGSKAVPSRIVQRSSEEIDPDDQFAARHRCLSRGEVD